MTMDRRGFLTGTSVLAGAGLIGTSVHAGLSTWFMEQGTDRS